MSENTTTCYFLNGDIDSQGHPCSPENAAKGTASACCAANDVCYRDGSCAQYNLNIPYLRSCTDPSWGGDACPSVYYQDACQDLRNMRSEGKVEQYILRCFPAETSNNSCCMLQGLSSCCFGNETTPLFTYNPGSVIALLDLNGAATSLDIQASGDGTCNGTNFDIGSDATSDTTADTQGSRVAEIALGAVLGVVVVVSGVGLATLWTRLRSRTVALRGIEAEIAAQGPPKYNAPNPHVELPGPSSASARLYELPNAGQQARGARPI